MISINLKTAKIIAWSVGIAIVLTVAYAMTFGTVSYLGV